MQEENKKLQKGEDVSGEVMYLVFTHIPVRNTVGGSGLCCCACVTSFKCCLTPLWVYSPNKGVHSAIYLFFPAGVFKSLICVCLHARSETNKL